MAKSVEGAFSWSYHNFCALRRKDNHPINQLFERKTLKAKAIFLDRDGTIIIDKNYLYKAENVEFIKGAITAMDALQAMDYKLFLVTNQSGIGRGMFNESDMHHVHDFIISKLKEQKIEILDIAFCPHAPEDNCACRKPRPLLINQLIKKYDIDPEKSYMIGDKQSDVDAGERAGVKGILLKENPTDDNEFTDLLSFTYSLK